MHYYVYIMTNPTWTTFYIGVTDDLERRVCEHKQKVKEGFTRRYNLTLLAYFEEGDEVAYAIGREKQLKGWLRRKKIALIDSLNPEHRDLSEGWY